MLHDYSDASGLPVHVLLVDGFETIICFIEFDVAATVATSSCVSLVAGCFIALVTEKYVVWLCCFELQYLQRCVTANCLP